MLKLKIILSFLLVMLSVSMSWSQVDSCENFKTGRYIYTPPNGGEVTIKRTKKKQIERYNNEHQRFIFTINWSSDCAYTLTLVRTQGVSRKLKKEILGTQLYCQIISSELNHYNIHITNSDKSPPLDLTIYLK